MMLSNADLAALWLTLRLACTVTVALFLLGTPLAWWLARSRSRWTHPVAADVALPLILPPTVLGFYLLVAFGPHGPIGAVTQSMGIGLLSFTFGGLVIASMLYSMPFVIQPCAMRSNRSVNDRWKWRRRWVPVAGIGFSR